METFERVFPPSGLLLVGGGRNAHNLVCVLSTAGIGIRGIVDDRPAGTVLGHEVGLIDDVGGAEVDALLTVANPDLAQAIRARPALGGCRWPRIVHPSAVFTVHARTGEGCYVGPYALVTDVDLGRHVHLFAHNVLGARVAVGDFTVLLPHATVASDARIGKRCIIGMGARIHAGVTIGDDCRVGVNAVVRHDMPDGAIAVSDARTRIRSRAVLGRSRPAPSGAKAAGEP
jgi:UDP-3-O-[3-hydroxymyristoyl] glucosamine N-acyltransferase